MSNTGNEDSWASVWLKCPAGKPGASLALPLGRGPKPLTQFQSLQRWKSVSFKVILGLSQLLAHLATQDPISKQQQRS